MVDKRDSESRNKDTNRKGTAVKIANSVTKLLLSAVPIQPITNIVLTCWSDLEVGLVSKRLDELESELKELDRKISCNVVRENITPGNAASENYYYFAREILDRFLKESRKEKRQYYERFLVNRSKIIFDDAGFDISEKILKIIDYLTINELLVLQYFKNVNMLQTSEEKDFIKKLCHTLNLNTKQLRVIVKCLESQYLLEGFSNVLDMQADDDELEPGGITIVCEKYITELGEEVMKNMIESEGR